MTDPAKTTEMSAEGREEMFSRLLDNQARDLEIRSAELGLRKQKDDHNFDLAKQALEGRVRDLRENREHETKRRLHTLAFAGGALLAVLLFIGFCVVWDREPIALELTKGAVLLAAGYLGGRGHQMYSSQADEVNRQDLELSPGADLNNSHLPMSADPFGGTNFRILHSECIVPT